MDIIGTLIRLLEEPLNTIKHQPMLNLVKAGDTLCITKMRVKRYDDREASARAVIFYLANKKIQSC
ncbi:MAG: hypothetical protein ACJAUP_000281 [Cellvibrionaceae bacterium]|jgi:hypothetical protein